jgi:hypothetical protein
MGIFGYLSKAHLEQNAPMDGITAEVQMIQYKIDREKAKINDNNIVLKQLDDTVAALIKNDKISSKNGAKSVRESQKQERESLNTSIEESMKVIDGLQEKKIELESKVKSLELEVGPIKYIANAVYGDQENNLEKAVTFAIMLIMVAFDPFAIILLMCANHSLILRAKPTVEPKSEPTIKVVYVDKKVEDPIADPVIEEPVVEEVIVDDPIEPPAQEDITTEPEIEDLVTNEEVVTQESRDQYVPAQTNDVKQDRLNALKEKLKRGEIGWLTPRK